MSDTPKDPKGFRPKHFPPPQFPPHRPRLFSRLPPAVFPAILGLLGLALALRRAMPELGGPDALAEVVLGAMVALWGFAAYGLVVKISRRPSVLAEDLRTLPGRAGIAAAILGLYLVIAGFAPYAPGFGKAMLVLGMALHLALAGWTIRSYLTAPAEAREVTPVWQLTFTGFIVAGVAALQLGWVGLATALFWITLPVAGAIWTVSALQLIRRVPPAPLRPLLAIHLAPAALLAMVAASIGQTGLALALTLWATAILLALVAALRWITQAGFTALWGAITFPLAALTNALYAQALTLTATITLAFAIGLIPWIAFQVVKSWASGQLAAKTNAAEA